MQQTVDLMDPRALNAVLVGRKAATLARCMGLDFQVPNGFVITTEATVAIFANNRENHENASAFSLSDSLTRELAAKLATYPLETRFAVRSSSPAEDGATASFAGQFDSVLNCTGVEAVCDAVLQCMRSLHSERSVEYRRFHGIEQADTIAVLIQEMISSEVGGVAFSIDPVSGSLEHVLVNAHTGLGTAVVDGEGVIEQYRVAKSDSAIPSSAETEVRCVTDNQLAMVVDLAVRVERAFGFPQDIEWAIEGGRLYLLQARPVTAFAPRWTRERSAERFPYPVTPLIWDIIEEGFHRSLATSLDIMGLPKFKGRWFSSREHYIYFNQNAVEIYARLSAAPLRHLRNGASGIRSMLAECAWVREPIKHWEQNLDNYLSDVSALCTRPINGEDPAELWRYAHDIRDLAYDYFAPNFAISMAHGLLVNALRETLTVLFGKERGLQAFEDLTANCGTKTGSFNLQLAELADTLATVPHLRDDVLALDTEAALAAVLSDESFGPVFQKFIRTHHHREIDHFLDPYYPSLGERPEVLVDSLRALLGRGVASQANPQQRIERHQKGIADILPDCSEEVRAELLELIELTRTYIALDDIEHYQTSRLHTPTRRCLGAIGQLLVRLGVIEEKYDACFASFVTFERAMKGGGWSQLGTEVRDAKASFAAAHNRLPSFSLESGSSTPVHSGLSGLGCSEGVTAGLVRILLNSDDFRFIEKGDILVARAMPPAWTSMFYLAGAIITEAGGPLSHGAVIAREIGIPAVMGVRGALEALQTGDLVRVDGAAGTITKVEQA